jgi:transposase
VKLANDALTKVRRRVTWDLRDRRGGKIDPEWANRRRLLRGRERLSEKSFAKMWNQIQAEDPSAQILTAWIAKEELRTLLATVGVGGDPHLTRHRLHRFLSWCIDSQIPELLTLAATVDDWWPEINAFVQTGITNARTEGYNRLVKQVKRVSCGFRNREHSSMKAVNLIAPLISNGGRVESQPIFASSGELFTHFFSSSWAICMP